MITGNYYNTISAKTERVIDMLEESFAGYGYEVREEYYKLNAENPVTMPIITVGIHGISQKSSDTARYLGKSPDGTTVYGKTLMVTYRITVHASASFAYSVCRSCAAKIAEAFTNSLDVEDITSSEAKYDRYCRCITMPVDITVKYIV